MLDNMKQKFDKFANDLPLSVVGGRTTTCIVMTPPGISLTGDRDSARVLLFSNIFPAFMSFNSFIVLGPFSFSVKK